MRACPGLYLLLTVGALPLHQPHAAALGQRLADPRAIGHPGADRELHPVEHLAGLGEQALRPAARANPQDDPARSCGPVGLGEPPHPRSPVQHDAARGGNPDREAGDAPV
jgi:hypothetical protein